MEASSHIRYLQQAEINKTSWDRCISNARNGLIYAYAYYLDQLAQQWDALVLGDYEAVMPLTWNRKHRFYYLYQPFLAAQLGVFGKQVNADLVRSFLAVIPSKFRYWDIYLNSQNHLENGEYGAYRRVNYILDLRKPYEILFASYRENARRNIRKAIQLECGVQKNLTVDQVISMAKAHSLTNGASISDAKYLNFKNLYDELHSKKQASSYGIFTASGEPLASAAFLFSHNRAYYILVGNHPNGKTIGASHLLIDSFVKDHAGKDLILDFEGSDIRSLAFFYSGFGAQEEFYTGLKWNRLPWWARLFKK